MSVEPEGSIARSQHRAEQTFFAGCLAVSLLLLALLAEPFFAVQAGAGRAGGGLAARIALGGHYLAGYPLALAGMYWFLRRRLARRDAAMLGSFAFTFSSFNLLHFDQPGAMAAVAHLPWLLAIIDVIMVDGRRAKVALAQAGLVLLSASQLLLGGWPYMPFSLLAEAGYTFFLGPPAAAPAQRLRDDQTLPAMRRLQPQLPWAE